MRAVVLIALLVPSASSFDFVDFFAGEWQMDVVDPSQPPSLAEYRMQRDGHGGLSGVYVHAGKELSVTVEPDEGMPASGRFARADNSTIFTYAFSAHHAGALQLSQDVEKGTTFAVTSPSSFLLLVATRAGAAHADSPIVTKSWAGVRKAPQAAAAQQGARPKSLLRRYGFWLIVLILGLLGKQAYDAASAPGATGGAGGAKPASGPAKGGKSKKAD
ncbi:hypothetical protein KFE25_013880 [Diacronema lutheri]|uniref:ER membrane protein complex subunit 10 n=1 Tax=Diacronema lutheri TaxID=2081491 RepID=A0A7R9UZL6_DIALT|nr:hypothetical protein KFE25_013880 [Diacronema lutheri]